MMIKLVIFDLDGVLVDACEWHRVALNDALKKVCGYEISIQQHKTTFNGLPTRIKLAKLTDLGILDLSKHDEIYKIKQSLTISIIKKYATKRLEKIELMKFLKNNNCHIACYTNSIRETAKLMLKKTGILNEIECLITNQDVIFSKPNPEGYNMLVEKFGLKKDEVIIVEDSPKGKQAAYDSGCNVIEVLSPDEVNVDLFKGVFK